MSGRGRGATLPAWMTKQEENGRPASNSAVYGQFEDANNLQVSQSYSAGGIRDQLQPQSVLDSSRFGSESSRANTKRSRSR